MDFVERGIAWIKQLFQRQQQDQNQDDRIALADTPKDAKSTEQGEILYDDTDPESRAKTVKKQAIIVAGGIVSLFTLTSVFSNVFDKNDADTTQHNQTQTTRASNIASPVEAFPDKYSELGKNDSHGDHANTRSSDVIAESDEVGTSLAPRRSNTVGTYADSNETRADTSSRNATLPNNSSNEAEKAARKKEEERQNFLDSIRNSEIFFTLTHPEEKGSIAEAATPVNAPSTNHTNNEASHPMPVTGGHTLYAGSVIQATLLTGVTSDINAEVVAQVRQNIYDSLTGEHLLIPQGSRILGRSSTGRGKRIAVTFQRIILPNGTSLDLPDPQAIDGAGYPGLEDKYDDHASSIYRAGFLTALLGAGMQSLTGNTSGTDNRSPGDEAVAGAVASILRTGEQLIGRSLNTEPTIEISPGYQFSVFVNEDLSIGAYHE